MKQKDKDKDKVYPVYPMTSVVRGLVFKRPAKTGLAR